MERLVTWIDYAGCPVSFHGRILNHQAHPWKSYFADGTAKTFRCLGTVDRLQKIDVPGTGVFGYHSSHIKFSIGDFSNGYMADVWAAKKLREEGVSCMVAPHAEGWIRHQDIDHSTTLWARYRHNDTEQTRVMNEVFSRDHVGA